MIVQCCACRRVREGNTWIVPEVPPGEGDEVSHGYCPVCAAQAFAQIRQQRGGVAGRKKEKVHAA